MDVSVEQSWHRELAAAVHDRRKSRGIEFGADVRYRVVFNHDRDFVWQALLTVEDADIRDRDATRRTIRLSTRARGSDDQEQRASDKHSADWPRIDASRIPSQNG
jgi:hypothetical protein